MIERLRKTTGRNGRDHWRSLEQLADDPQFRDFLESEFPSVAADFDNSLNRRQLLTLMGASLAMAGLASCRRPEEKIVPYVTAPENIIPGVPKQYATTMPFGHRNYGVLVESHEGRPTKIEGNALHPATKGASSALIQAAILGLYDPDRSRSVRNEGATKDWEDFVTAWKEILEAHVPDGGEGLAVLTESFSSPTLKRLETDFRNRFPNALWSVYEPVSDENVHAGVGGLQPVYHFEKTSVILSLDSDFLLTESDCVAQAKGFAQARRVQGPQSSMCRLYAVEAGFTITGAAADNRLRLKAGDIGALIAALAHELQKSGVGLDAAGTQPVVAGVDPDWLSIVARDLAQAGPGGVVVAGRRQPPEVHAIAAAINAALGSAGEAVTYHALEDASLPDRSQFAELVSGMKSGSIKTLVMLGGNPLYSAPADLEFGRALAAVEVSAHLSTHYDETSQAASWHVPQSHFLEAWGDGRSLSGDRSVVQPLIAPLHGSKSAVEVLGLLADGEDSPGFDRVQATWEDLVTDDDFEKGWRRILHDGIARDTETPAASPGTTDVSAALAALSGGSGDSIEVVFQASPAVFDGRFANSGWLQEMPDPMTKITWDNAALMSPRTADRIGVSNGEVVRISSEGREIEAPTWIQPGHADDSVTLPLGYGRQAAGRIGNGVGFDATVLRSSRNPDFAAGVEVARTRRTHELVGTQDHGSMEGRPLVLEATLQEYRDKPDFVDAYQEPPNSQLFPFHDYGGEYQWGLAIDLTSCVGCNACLIGCQSENNVPIVGKEQVAVGREMHWIRVDRYFSGPPEEPEAVFQPLPCQHCENAPCEEVCPVAATVHDSEGINQMVYNRCIGTRYCSNNCPYKVRRFNFLNFTKDTPEVQKMVNNPDVTVRSRGVMEKCSYCVQRVNAAKQHAKRTGQPLTDGDVQTACQQACPTGAIIFGNIADPTSRVAEIKAGDRDYLLVAELNTKPRTSYQAKITNPNPALAGNESSS